MSTFHPTITEKIKQLPIYLSSTGIYFEETMISRSSGYSDYQWIQTISGHGELRFNNETYFLSPNTGIFIPSHIPHEYHKTSANWITSWITFNGNNIEQLVDSLGLTSIDVIYLADNLKGLNDIDEIFYLATSNYTSNAFKISTMLYSNLDQLLSSHKDSKPIKSISKNSHLNIALEYIDQYYMMELTINELAKFIRISPQYLCRLFKEQLNSRPFEYIKQVRINKAKSMLLQTPTPKIEHVAKSVGFVNASYFTSIFKKLEKITPRDFIKLHQRGV